MAIEAFNKASAAGVCAKIKIEFENQLAQVIVTDKSWKVANQPAEGWTTTGFNESAWNNANEVAAFGKGVWGTVEMEPHGGSRIAQINHTGNQAHRKSALICHSTWTLSVPYQRTPRG